MAKTYSDAIAKLEADHDRIEDLFEKVDKASGAEKRRLGIQAANLVKIHMTLEEEFFYPALRGKGDDDKITEGLVEHDAGKFLINDILSPETDDDSFGPKVQVLGEQMEHHHKEEEEDGKGVFDQARKAKIDLVAMLDAMLERETELSAQLSDDDLPPSDMNFVNAAEST
ncbi:MAG: hemerythrin [Novosphingobium sp.]|nr:hemerythrin [Novosphingobium sp.]